jgi:16S rRNA (uracil1498-N3)-methyltransferase
VTAPLFLIDRHRLGVDTVVLSGREGHHAADVRRLRTGEAVEVSDGAGLRLRCTVASIGRGEVTLRVESREHEPAAVPRVEVAQALIKQDAAERALATMTEVGVDAIRPWAAARSVVTWDDDRVERGVRRWRSTVAEAAKQSRRAWVPDVSAPLTTADLLRRVGEVDVALLLDSDAADPLGALDIDGDTSVLIVVGPEGGQTEDESAALAAAGARRFHLGPTVLRSATAGTVAAAVVLARTPRWSTRAFQAPAG